jgi:hypothetical protein
MLWPGFQTTPPEQETEGLVLELVPLAICFAVLFHCLLLHSEGKGG